MTSPDLFSSDCWPTAQQELLLQAAISEPEYALAAWNRWIPQVDINKIDQGSYRILPLVYRRLGYHLESDPLIQKLKGVYRRTWYKNQVLFHHMAKLVQLLESSGIKTLILKGAALVHLYYNDCGLRPMDDFDILVRPSQARRAIEIVLDQNFSPRWPLPESLTDEYLHVTDQHGFTDTGSRIAEIHWYAIAENTGFDYDEECWHTAVSLEINGASTLALDATHQLLHLCAHGIEWNTVPNLRWICDSLTVLGSATDSINWQDLVETTKSRRLVLPIRSALKYLKSHFAAPIPSLVLEELENVPISKFERNEYSLKTHRWSLWWGHLPQNWFIVGRHYPDKNLFARALKLISNLSIRWDATSSWKLIGRIFGKIIEKLNEGMKWHITRPTK